MTRKTGALLAFAVTMLVAAASSLFTPTSAAAARRPLTASLQCSGGAKDPTASMQVTYYLDDGQGSVGGGTVNCHDRQVLSRGNSQIPAFTVTILGIGAETIRCAAPPPGPLPYVTGCANTVFTIE